MRSLWDEDEVLPVDDIVTPTQPLISGPVHRSTISTPVGDMVAYASPGYLVLLEFNDRIRYEAQTRTLKRYVDGEVSEGSNEIIEQTRTELDQYFKGQRTVFDVPRQTPGTPFQMEVWDYLSRIEHGQTATYHQIASALGKESAARAVGKANGDNRIAIIVPCHRVIRADGDLCGYAGGLPRKRFLLALESGQPSLL